MLDQVETAELAELDESVSSAPADAPRDVFQKVARSGLLLGGRRVFAMVITAVTTVVVARGLGAVMFGVYAAALSTAQLLAGLSDFGFSLVLGRDLARPGARPASLMRGILELQTLCACLLTAGVLGLALAAGLDTARGQVLLVLSPMVLFSSLSCARQYYVVRFDVRFLAVVDVVSALAMGVGTIIAAVATDSAAIVAAAFAVPTVVQGAVIAVAAFRRVGFTRVLCQDRVQLLRAALPLGVVSFLSTFYFVIDLALLGWLVSGPQLGNYAAAVKILSVLVALPGLVMSTALPGLSAARSTGPAE